MFVVPNTSKSKPTTAHLPALTFATTTSTAFALIAAVMAIALAGCATQQQEEPSFVAPISPKASQHHSEKSSDDESGCGWPKGFVGTTANCKAHHRRAYNPGRGGTSCRRNDGLELARGDRRAEARAARGQARGAADPTDDRSSRG